MRLQCVSRQYSFKLGKVPIAPMHGRCQLNPEAGSLQEHLDCIAVIAARSPCIALAGRTVVVHAGRRRTTLEPVLSRRHMHLFNAGSCLALLENHAAAATATLLRGELLQSQFAFDTPRSWEDRVVASVKARAGYSAYLSIRFWRASVRAHTAAQGISRPAHRLDRNQIGFSLLKRVTIL